MLELERLEQILTYLRLKQTATVATLAKQLYTSEATVRRDLTKLQQKGLVKRIHGGVTIIDESMKALPLYVRERQNPEAKQIIAKRAARYLRDGQIIFLDSSNTASHLIKYFEAFNSLTIVTNGLKATQELSSLKHNVYCTGGLIMNSSASYVGEFAANFIRNFNADIFFFSSRGVTEDGWITDASPDETHIRRVMYERSKKRIFLCDQSKRGKSYCYNFCSVDQVDDYISDD